MPIPKSSDQKLFGVLPPRLAGLVTRFEGVFFLGALARVAALGSQFVVLLVLSWILPKAELGNAMVAFTFYRLLSMAIGTGFGNALLYHVSRANGDAILDRALLRTMSIATGGVVLIVLLPIIIWADQAAALFGKPDLAPWLLHMAPLALFGALNLVSAASLDARSRIVGSILLTEVVPNALRLAGFLALALFNAPGLTVAWVIWLALALPWLVDLSRMLQKTGGFAPITGKDAKNVISLTVYTLAAVQLQGIDIIVIGLLFPSNVVADYAIAARIASLFPFFMQLSIRSFSPRAGRLIAARDTEGLAAELAMVQKWGIRSSLAATAILLTASPLLLQLFGNYGEALPLLCLLALPPVYRSFYAGADRLLQLAGHAHVSTTIMVVAFAIVAGLPFLLADRFGALAMPLAMLTSGVILNPVIAQFLHALLGIKAITPRLTVVSLLLIPLGLACTFLLPAPSFGIAIVMAAYLVAFAPRSPLWKTK